MKKTAGLPEGITGLPDGITSEQLVEIMKRVVSGYGNKFRFTIQECEDIEQRAWELALEALAKNKYDPAKADLEHFLRVHVRNRLINDKRDLYIRNDSPCKSCPLNAFIDLKCTAYEDPLMECEWFGPWEKRNQSRKYIAHPIPLDNVDPIGEQRMEYRHLPFEDLESNEVWSILEESIPTGIESLYWAWKTGYEPGRKRKKNLNEEETFLVESYVRKTIKYLYEF